MTSHKKDARKIMDVVDAAFTRYANLSQKQVDSAIDRAWDQLKPDMAATPEWILRDGRQTRRLGSPIRLVAVAAAVLFVVLATVIALNVTRPQGLYAFVEMPDSATKAGTRIDPGTVVRSSGPGSMVLSLADGSRIEMRPQSELSLERADDGSRIRLIRGSVIVNAAKQRTGHLYVQTKDVTVSVVGTVFLVNAEEAGSRVAVIEGEVRVQQGTTMKKLLPGDQVATSPVMQSVPVIEEILWSRNATTHLALLQQALVVPAPTEPQGAPDDRGERVAFEVATIRAIGPGNTSGSRGGGLPLGAAGLALQCTGEFSLQLDPNRLFATNITLYALTALAFGNRCPAPGGLSGGPDWIKSEMYEVQAILPDGGPTYTRSELLGGNAPGLQKMLQTMLAERFKITVRREMKEMPVYNLVVATEGKLTLSKDQSGAATLGLRGYLCGVCVRWDRNGVFTFQDQIAPSTTIAAFANGFQVLVGRPIIDKTGLKGLYDIRLEFPELGQPMKKPPDAPAGDFLNWSLNQMRDLVPRKLEEQLGLKLEPARAPVEVLVIEHAEKPSEN